MIDKHYYVYFFGIFMIVLFIVKNEIVFEI